MSKLDILRQQFNGANVSDDMIARGSHKSLTSKGTAVLCKRLSVTKDELDDLLDELQSTIKKEAAPSGLPASPDIFEDCGERFEYESDVMANVMLRDSKTGATRYLQGSDGAKFLREVERVHPNYQEIIAPYFNDDLMEFARADVTVGDNGETGGTYNFPFRGKFAVARFWLAGNKPMVEIVSLMSANGEEVAMDDSTKAAATATAWEWVNKV
jgi:hypothetical protein